MIYFLLILNFLTFNSFASSGDGVGNGGLGYECTISSNGEKVILTLDLIEDLEQHYHLDYFREFELSKKDHINKILSSNNNYAEEVKDLVKLVVDLDSLRNLNIFTSDEFDQIKLAKKELLQEALVYIHSKLEPAPENRTLDSGKIKLPSTNILMEYGLTDCKIVQIAVYGYVDKGYVGKVLALRLHRSSLINMDDFSLKALLWHEVIYRALDDVNSQETRQYVSTLMQKLY